MDGLNWYIYTNNNPINFVDPWGLSITATGSIYDIFTSYWEMQMLTNDRLQFNSATGEITINTLCTEDLSKPTGTELVRSLVDNVNFTLKIQRNEINLESGNKYGTQVIGNRSDVVTINMSDDYNTSENYAVLVKNSKGINELQYFNQIPSYIFLGHEMIHAYHHMLRIFNGISGGHRYYLLNGKVYDEWIKSGCVNDEFDTVGLSYIGQNKYNQSNGIRGLVVLHRPGSITENSLRTEHGLPIRMAYNTFVREG